MEDDDRVQKLESAVWKSLDVATGMPNIVVAETLLTIAAMALVHAGVEPEEGGAAMERTMTALLNPATVKGVHVLQVPAAEC